MPNQGVSIVSIHDKQNGILACDLKDVLVALDEDLSRWVWCVTDFDAIGTNAEGSKAVEEFNSKLDAAGDAGVWLASRDLTALAAHIGQTIDGTVFAFPQAVDRAAVGEADLRLAEFSHSAAELAICVVDSSFVEVYSKDSVVVSRLRRHYRDVQEEDPQVYFRRLTGAVAKN